MKNSTIEEALLTIGSGGMVVVIDDEDRENEGDLVMAAEFATPEKIAFITRNCTGIICAPMPASVADRLELPLMVENNTESMKTAFTVPVDLIQGTTTGVSAHDRAATLRALADPSKRADEFARPGHIFPLRARQGGVLERPGHTEASVDLCRLANLNPVAVICELVNDDGTMSRLVDIEATAARYRLPVITIDALIAYRRQREAISASELAAKLGLASSETRQEIYHLFNPAALPA
jgi:3,4-dihydroxy 2-butanone 4-phosphate synthase/GTP cyclohydrolase II